MYGCFTYYLAFNLIATPAPIPSTNHGETYRLEFMNGYSLMRTGLLAIVYEPVAFILYTRKCIAVINVPRIETTLEPFDALLGRSVSEAFRSNHAA